jgi:NADH:ubiquinone oxidoreductase subunit 6 (subunit J)
MVSVFLLSALLFFEQTLFFLAMAYLIVYVGAIAILFIFVLKLLPRDIEPSQEDIRDNTKGYTVLYLLGFAVLLLAISYS